MKTERALCLLMSITLAACADTINSTKAETETHFLQSCESSCEDGLSCVCGVCTQACTSDSACEALASSASCATIPSACGHLGDLCDVTCTVLDDCEAFGTSFECVSGRCRARVGHGTDGGAVDNACNEAGDACCDPSPQDGPNYCNNTQLKCGANNTCEINCDCGVLGANFPVCGVDGRGYDTTCGVACVPVEIACMGTCPCPPSM